MDKFFEHSGYQKTEIGLLPVDWIIVPIGKVVTLSQYGLSIASEDQGTIPIVGMKDLSSGKVKLNNLAKVSIEQEDVEKFCLQPGDILLNRTNSYELVGKASIYTSDSLAVFASYLVRFQFDITQALPEFINCFLNFSPAQQRLKRIVTKGVSQANINPTVFRNQFIIPLPPIEEQKKIAEILATWDEAITLTERALIAHKHRKDVLSHKLLFGKSRVMGLGNNQPMKQHHWFSASKDWEVVQLKDIAIDVGKRNTESQNLPVLSCTKNNGLVDSLKYFGKQVFSEDTSTYKVVARGQFVYATNHIEEGSIGYQNLYDGALISPMYTVFQSTSSEVDDGYLYKLLKTETLRCIFQANTSASVDRRGSLRWKQFSAIKVPLPPIEEQREINHILNTAQLEIDKLLKYKNLLQVQKRGLMQKLLTGECRVAVYDAA